MGLSLIVGPANAGKVALLLDRYRAALDREPFLVVPNVAEVERIERELLASTPALFGGAIGTWDDLFGWIAFGAGGDTRPAIRPSQRRLLLGRVVAGAELNGLSASARFPGFAESLGNAIGDAQAALLEPGDLDGPLAALYERYRAELDRLGLWDRDLTRRHAAELVGRDLAAWDGRPVFAYGFEDFTGAEWSLLEALAGRGDVTVSLPYEVGRPVFGSLTRTADDLTRLADGRIEELPPQAWEDARPLTHLERTLFTSGGAPTEPPPLDGSVRFLEAAGTRAALELVAEDVLELLRDGTPPEDVAVLAPSVERVRGPLETAFGALGVPYAIEGSIPLDRTPFGRALLGLLRFAWLGGTRRHLFSFLRTRSSGLPRGRADFVEGRLRGRAITDPARVEEEAVKLLGHTIPALDAVRAAPTPREAVRVVAGLMVRAAYGLESPPVGPAAGLDLRAHQAVRRAADDLDGWAALAGEPGPDAVVATLEHMDVRLHRPREEGRVAVLDLARARTRRFDAVFVLGLEEGTFPRRSVETPFLPDETRRELEQAAPARRLVRPDPLERDRYLFYTACTRPRRRLTLVREAATDDGRPQEPSPFWLEARSRFAPDELARWTRKRSLAELTWPVDRAPTQRERLRAVARLGADGPDEARALARANGWERRVERALAALDRPTVLTNPAVLGTLRELERFSVTELETFGTCSAMWLVDRVIDPREIDPELDARIRGSIVHGALYRFYSGLPKRLGIEQVDAERLEDALVFLRECLAEAIEGQVRLDLTDVQRLELEGRLARDLEHFVRQEIELDSPLVPRRFEVTFGTQGAPVEMQRGLELGGFRVSGKIDRIDLDPMSARGIVQDYKSGSGAHSAREIETQGKLQIPLYVLALRDLVGIEPLGGLYRALSGPREARGLLRETAAGDGLPELKKPDYLDEDAFWGAVDAAVERARDSVGRAREGDVQHDPRGGTCPTWCDRWTMCRIRRA